MNEHAKSSTKTALIVEDSSSMRGLVVSSLEAEGFEVSEACTGFQAIKELQLHPFDLIVTDINMPDLTGLEIIKFARSTDSHEKTPLLVISTDSESRDKDRALALGANHYLVKPFLIDELIRICNELLEEK